MDKEVRQAIEELQEAHRCVILISFMEDGCHMKVFFDDGRVSEDVILGTKDDSKCRVLINMRKYFRQDVQG